MANATRSWIDDTIVRLRQRATEYSRKGCDTTAIDLEIEAQRLEVVKREQRL